MNFNNNTIPWIEKYRPKDLNNIIAHDEIRNVLNSFIEKNGLPHLLFYGPPGTCKTTTARAIANKIYGKLTSSMVLELNSSDERGIETVREKIKEFACTQKLFDSNVKMIILDEVDAMTNEAQFALRRIIENFTENVRFCLICNYVNKVIPALQSRCTRFRFSHLENNQLKDYINYIVKEENINITEDAKNTILDISKGDMRKLLNILQIANMTYDEITEERIYESLGLPLKEDIKQILNILFNENIEDSFLKIKKIIFKNSYNLHDIVMLLFEELKKYKFNNEQLKEIYTKFSDIEYKISTNSNENAQIANLGCVLINIRKKNI
jgi:replication factor C subunit 3/5